MNRHLRVAAALTAIVLAAGCGAPTGGARAIDPEAVPYALLSPTPSEASPQATDASALRARVFLVDPDDQLVAVASVVDATDPELVVVELLSRLAEGPGETERQRGLISALGPDVTLELVELTAQTAEVEVSLPSGEPAADRLPLAIGQIVLTVTSVEEVQRVQLLTDGEPLEMALPGGARTSDPVTAEDYLSLLGT